MSHLQRYRRQTSKDDPTVNKSPITSPTDDANKKTSSNETNASASIKPPNNNGGGATTTPVVDDDDVSKQKPLLPPSASKPTFITPSLANSQQPLLGANGTGQRKDIYITTKTPLLAAMKSDKNNSSIESNKTMLDLLYPASGIGKPIKITDDDDEVFDNFDKPDSEINKNATTNNITTFKEV